MKFDVLIMCNNGKRQRATEKIKNFKDVKNIQQKKNQNELIVEVESNDERYVKNNIVMRMQDIDEITNAAIIQAK